MFALCAGSHLFAAMLFGVVERKADNAVGAGNRNRFNGNARIGTNHARALSSTKIDEALRFGRAFFEFDAGIEVFRILANNNEVDIFVTPARARESRAPGEDSHTNRAICEARHSRCGSPCPQGW